MLPKTGKKLHHSEDDGDLASLISAALKAELGATHQTVKTAMRWTGASDRTVKHWLAGSHSPRAEHLVALVRHSDEVLKVFLRMSGRNPVTLAVKLKELRKQLLETVEYIERCI